jgi:hypothetical protein
MESLGKEDDGHEDDGHDEHGEITVEVFAPRTPEPKIFTWPKSLLVGEAAKSAASEFKYAPGTPGLQTADKHARVLDNSKTLETEKLHNHDKLELIDTGGGV